MASSFKRSYLKPTTSGLDIAYTVPGATTGIAISGIATATNGTNKTVSVGVAPTGATEPNWISRNIPITAGSSVNLLPERVALATGDRVVVNADADLAQLLQTATSMPITNPKYMAVNTAGTIILVGGDNGVAKSTDGGLSFTMSNGIDPTNSGFNLLRFFNSKFIYFASETAIYTSTDATTWTKVIGQAFPTSNVVGNATKLVGINNGSLYESTDGTTWTSAVTQGMPVNLKTMGEININSVWYGASIFVAVGDNGVILMSNSTPKSYEWTQLTSGVTDNLHGVTMTSAATIIVGDNGRILTGVTGLVATSTWTSQTSGTTETLRGVAWNTTSTVTTAVGDAGTIITSNANGTSWTLRTSGVSTRLNAVGINSTQTAAVGDSGVILTSDGAATTWTSRTSGTSEHLYGVFFSVISGHWWAVGATGTIVTAASANLTAWTIRTSGTTEHLYCVNTSPGNATAVLIGGANGKLLYADGLYSTFTIRNATSSVTSDIYSISSNNGSTHTIFVGKKGLIGGSTYEYTSSNVESVNLIDCQVTSGTSEDLNAIFWNGTVAVAVGNTGTILTSNSSLTTWTARTSGTSSHLYAVHFVGSVWVAVGAAGAVTVGNTAATTWTNQTAISANNLYGLHTGPSSTGFITVGAGGVIFTGNAAGTTWTAQTNADTQDLYSVAYNSATPNFIAVGGNAGTGRVLLGNSAGTAWSVQTSGVTQILRSVCWYSNNFVAVGDAGTVITAANAGTAWTIRTSGVTDNLKYAYTSAGALPAFQVIQSSNTVAAFGANGTFLTSSGNAIFLARSQSSTTQINSYAEVASGRAVSVGPGGKILAYGFINGGWQESFVIKPHEITSITTHSNVIILGVGTGAMSYGGAGSTNTWRWNVLGPTVAGENNLKCISFNGVNSMIVGNNGFMGTNNSTVAQPTQFTSMTNLNLNGVVWNGNRHIVVGDEGAIFFTTGVTNNMLLTRTASGTSNRLNGVANTTNGGGVTVIVGDNGTILTSTGSAGTSWTSQTSGTAEHLYGVTYNTSQNNFIAVGANGTILTSNSAGTTWTARTSGVTRNLNAVYVGLGTNGLPVAVGDAGVMIYADVTGVTWTLTNSGVTHNLKGGTAGVTGTSNFVVGAGYTILDTVSPVTPIVRSAFSQYFIPRFIGSSIGVINSGQRPIMVGEYGMIVYGGAPYTATNYGSAILFPKFSGTYYHLNGVVGNSNPHLMAVGENGTIIFTSTPMSSQSWFWFSSGTTTVHYNGVAFGTSNFTAVGDGGRVSYISSLTMNNSTSLATSNTTDNLNAVTYQNSGTTWAAVGDNGRIISVSVEAPTTWTVRTSGVAVNLNAIASDATPAYVAVGDGGTIVTAPITATPWTVRSSGVTTDLNAVASHTTNSYTIVGDAGVYLYTSGGVTSYTAATTGTTTDLMAVSASSSNSASVFSDSVGNVFYKPNFNNNSTSVGITKMALAELATTGALAYGNILNPIIGATAYTIYYVGVGRTAVSYDKTSTSAITDVTSIGDSSNLFIVSQTTGLAYSTTDFSAYTSAELTGKYTNLIGNRVLLGESTVVSATQASGISGLQSATPVALGPSLALNTYFDRSSNVVYAINSSGQLWRIDDITSTTPRGGVQFVVSVTEFA